MPRRSYPSSASAVHCLSLAGLKHPPHGQAEFVIDPADKRLEKLTEESKDTAIKKKVLREGSAVRARIPKHAEEVFADAEHVRDRPASR